MLQDLVMAAVNEAMRQMEELVDSEMNKITGGFGGGLGIPGF
jgi:DNA-binding protein YbaB